MHSADKVDLIIIGGGALGTFHAYHALEKGLSVRLFEKNQQPQGATVRNFGQVVPSGMDLTWQRYGRKSLAVYKKIQQQFDITVRSNGSIYFASNEEEMTLLEELRQINGANGYPSRLLTQRECLENYEGLRADYVLGGLFFPDEITVEARSMIHRVLDYLTQQRSLHYHPSTLIQHVDTINGTCQVVDSSGHVYSAEKVVICSGSEFKTLYPKVFAESDMEVTKLQMLQTVPQPQQRVDGNILTGLSIRRYESFRDCPSYPAIKEKEDAQALWKKWSVHILFKQSPDGSFIIGDSHEYADAAQADDLGFDLYPEINRYMLDEARKIFDLQDWSIQREWFGVYSQCKTKDIFRHNPHPNIHIVTGIGGKGMTASPGFAQEHIAELFSFEQETT
ncbi:MAG: TIGR03364 family FAD-dependent oxidoreductase [Cyclobacteriaceae bacterium]